MLYKILEERDMKELERKASYLGEDGWRAVGGVSQPLYKGKPLYQQILLHDDEPKPQQEYLDAVPSIFATVMGDR